VAAAAAFHPPQELLTVRDSAQAAALLQPQRLRLLEELGEPNSAAGLARRLGLPRQQLNYHLRELERAGLVELVEERRRGNCTERMLVATARRYVISPEVLGGLGAGFDEVRDHFSSTSLVAVAARAIRELGELRARADEQGKRLSTMTLDSQLLFASVEARNAFAKELSESIARLIVTYHDATAPAGQMFRLVVGAYPSPARGAEGETEGGHNHER
jgi:DNA-binding transcriptional ArsR family regulator